MENKGDRDMSRGMRMLVGALAGALAGVAVAMFGLPPLLGVNRHDLFTPGEEVESIFAITVFVGLPALTIIGAVLGSLTFLIQGKSRKDRQ